MKIGLYLLSLWLLFVLIFINKIKVDLCLQCKFANGSELLAIAAENYLPFGCVALLLVSLGFYWYFKRIIKDAKDGPYKLKEVEDKNADHLVFLATYVVPLLSFGLDNVRQVIDLIITLLVIGAIYVRTNLFYANPTLAILGFKIFSAKLESGPVILISLQEIKTDDSVNLLRLDRRIFFARKALIVPAP